MKQRKEQKSNEQGGFIAEEGRIWLQREVGNMKNKTSGEILMKLEPGQMKAFPSFVIPRGQLT